MREIYGTAKEWLEYAKNDLDSAEFLTKKVPVPIEIICYLCQQSAEKSLKAFLIFWGLGFQKTHDTSLLCAECKKQNPQFESLYFESALLKNYSVTSRYPYPLQIEESDMKNALSAARKIFDFVQKELCVGEN